ncbi:hypothetical protein ACHAW6_014589 [Cyclotella cf. meneghiniana]
MLAAWKKHNSPPNHAKPIPMRDAYHISHLAQNSSSSESPHITVTYMLIIAFFFLLHPDKYTDSNTESTQFASPTCMNQKNGVKGEVIGLACSGDHYIYLVQAIACCIICLTTLPHLTLF